MFNRNYFTKSYFAPFYYPTFFNENSKVGFKFEIGSKVKIPLYFNRYKSVFRTTEIVGKYTDYYGAMYKTKDGNFRESTLLLYNQEIDYIENKAASKILEMLEIKDKLEL